MLIHYMYINKKTEVKYIKYNDKPNKSLYSEPVVIAERVT
uniref:Uncharacterized protein n=1 Tax=Arundo donax TaxID=35708 RepID=A0A0A9F113_ARUDO